ncbi:MAG: hypothetical protein HY053_05845 [Proteobacteria bacterium]|nr:hypothetical protein [Pseudomonadota bacterium]
MEGNSHKEAMSCQRMLASMATTSLPERFRPWMPAFAGMTFLFAMVFLITAPARAEPAAANGIASAIKRSGLPLPRWASLRGESVYMRAGPGFRYPILWVFRRKGLPVEITAEFDTWRRIRDSEGAEGWVHQSNLSGKRAFLITGRGMQTVFRERDERSSHRAEAEAGVQGRLLRCREEWCKVEVDGIGGYMKREVIWGVYENEKVD